MIRSFLFIPGDSDKKLGKAESFPADALILDLEDAVAADRKAGARVTTRTFLESHPTATRPWQLWVRINPLSVPDSLRDLAAIVGGAPEGILLPKSDGPKDVARLAVMLDALEVRDGIPPESIKIMTVATETPIAPFALGDYAAANLPRLSGLTWGAEDLSAAVGANTNLDAQGQWALTYRLVRSLTLLAARAAGIEPIETIYADFKDSAGLLAASRAAYGEGFTGRIAIHPDQVPIINAAFTPSAEEIAFAERVVAAFAAQPAIGTVGLDGKMLDRPHLQQAQRVIESARRAARG